jgi:hypothetical protein
MSAVCIDFDTDFASFFEPPLQKVATLSDIDVDSFRRRFRAPGVPLIIEGESENWPALQLWPKLEYLKRKVGQEPVFVRDLDRGNISGVAYREPYLRLPFSEFIDRISGPKPQNLYLTQGIVRRPAGVLRAFERARSPAILTALAGDLPAPRLWRPREVLETNLWLGPGGHGSPLHFDELDNLNAVITGCKRWLLFPSVEVEKLTAGGRDARQSIARGFHAGEPDRFVTTTAAYCARLPVRRPSRPDPLCAPRNVASGIQRSGSQHGGQFLVLPVSPGRPRRRVVQGPATCRFPIPPAFGHGANGDLR